MTGTQSTYNNNATREQVVGDTKVEISQQRGPTRSWRSIVFNTHKKVSTVTGSTSTTKTRNCRKERWDKCKSAICKKLKVIAKEMEILHQTQPHNNSSTGPLWFAMDPTGYGYHSY